MKRIDFGIIGCGLMGREMASAAARWCHLLDIDAQPELVAVCNRSARPFPWFEKNFPGIKQFTDDYHELLANPDVEFVYCAVPHNLHQQFYCDIISSGKHLLGEKPFGIDKAANDAILACMRRHPKAFVRCSTQFIFLPAVQRICDMIESRAFGNTIEVHTGFLHSSDLDPNKPINWKRMVEINGEYGVMGDLGMHACLVPFRAGWKPRRVNAVLSKIVKQRPDGKGGMAPCRTWDNATLLCESVDPVTGETFPWTLKTHRIAPGEKNTWYVEILGTKACARFSTKNPKLLQVLEYSGGEQSWHNIDMGYETAFKTVSGGIFEFGFSDAILQMFAAFIYEMSTGKPLKRFAGCATPEEVALSHALFTAALESYKECKAVPLSV